MEIVQNAYRNLLALIPFLVIFMFITIKLMRSYIYSIYDESILLILTISTSLSYLLLLTVLGQVDPFYFVQYTFLFIIFFFGVNFASQVNGKINFYGALEKIIENLTKEEKQDINSLLNILFILSLIAQGFLSLQMLLQGLSAGGRLEISKQFMIVQFIAFGAFPIYSIFISFLFRINGRVPTKCIVHIIIYSIVSILSGSKGGLLSLFFTFCNINYPFLMSKGKYKKLMLTFLVLSVGTMVIASSIVNSGYGESFIDTLVYDLLMRGDVYSLALVQNGGVEKYYGIYNPIMYFLHPFLLLIGQRGYDIPLGTRLAKDASGQEFGGANNHLPILLDILFSGNIIACILVCFVSGWICYVLKKFYVDKIMLSSLHIIDKVAIMIPCSTFLVFCLDASVYAFAFVVGPMVTLVIIKFMMLIDKIIHPRITEIN